MKATEIFTPGTLPKYTYYERPELDLEQKLLDAVDTPGIIAAVSGPSKSGKTVLCETVIGLNSMLLVTGGGIESEHDLWRRIRSKINFPAQSSTSTGAVKSREIGADATAGISFLGKAEAGFSGKLSRSVEEQATLQFDPVSGAELIQRIKGAGKTLVVDDFHYIDRGIQASIVEQFKEAARAGCTIVVVSVPHRSDDVIRANPDLRGRVRIVEVTYWSEAELQNIPNLGFPKLNLNVSEGVVARLAKESLSSPQLMQSLCLDLCRAKRIDDALETITGLDINDQELTYTLRSVASASNCQTALDILEKGPRVRGTDRKAYTLRDGTVGDVYTVVLKAIATGEPRLTLQYSEIRDRTAQITRGEGPSGSSISSTLGQMEEAARQMKQGDRVIEWDVEKETLNFPDPYFLYYLRWKF